MSQKINGVPITWNAVDNYDSFSNYTINTRTTLYTQIKTTRHPNVRTT